MSKVNNTDAKPKAKLNPQIATKESVAVAAPKAKELSASTQSKLGKNDRFTSTRGAFQPAAEVISKEAAPRDLGNPKARAQLASVSQVNEISRAYGNKDDICGAATVVATLLLQSGTDAGAKANAAALDAGFKRALNGLPEEKRADVDATLTPGVNTALEHLAQRTLSEDDVGFLQQAAYTIGRATMGDSKEPGLSTGAMAAMVADLKGSGATFAAGTSFSQVHDKVGGHWVAQQGATFINSAEKGTPAATVDAKRAKPTAPDFSGRVRVTTNGDVELQTRWRDGKQEGAGKGFQTTLTPIDPRNDVLRAFQGNGKRLGEAINQAVSGQLAD